MAISMRPAGPGDADLLDELAIGAVTTARGEVRVVEREGVAVGAVRVEGDPVDDDDLRIAALVVRPADRGRGIAAAVLAALDEESARAGRSMTVALERGSPAVRLFARAGFVRAGETPEGGVVLRRS